MYYPALHLMSAEFENQKTVNKTIPETPNKIIEYKFKFIS